jgi:hypothetical protein
MRPECALRARREPSTLKQFLTELLEGLKR